MLIVLDWDGTLVDSADRIVASMQAAAAEVGLAVPDGGAVRAIIGLGLPEAFAKLWPGIDPRAAELLRESYSRHFVAADRRQPAGFFPGVHETLEALRRSGCELAIATGKSRRGLERALGDLDLGDYFDASRCADETRSKPHPLMLEELLAETGRRREEAVMVGDTEFDLQMAAAAGVASVAVTWGVHERERLERCTPALVIDEFSALLGWVQQRLRRRPPTDMPGH